MRWFSLKSSRQLVCERTLDRSIDLSNAGEISEGSLSYRNIARAPVGLTAFRLADSEYGFAIRARTAAFKRELRSYADGKS